MAEVKVEIPKNLIDKSVKDELAALEKKVRTLETQLDKQKRYGKELENTIANMRLETATRNRIECLVFDLAEALGLTIHHGDCDREW